MTVASESAGLLVIAVDRLPAWMLPAYGATWVATPAFDRLAARGVVFDRVITTSTDPVVTLRQLVGTASTGGVGGPESGPESGAAQPPLLAAAVARRGFPATIVTDDAGTAMAGILETGGAAPRAAVVRVSPDREPGSHRTVSDTWVGRLADAAVEAVAGGARCLVCHVSSLGLEWDAPEEYRQRYVDPQDPPPPRGATVPTLAVAPDTDPDLVVGYRQAFAGQLTLLDEQIGRLLAAVDAAGGGWTILVVGLRGLPLGLHGWLGTGGSPGPFGELVHVPAILVDAAGRMAGQRYAGLVTPADLGATLPELVGGGPAAGREVVADRPWCGRSLAGLFESWTASPRDRVVVAGEGAVAIVTPAWHAVLPRAGASGTTQGRVRVFAKPDDYFELVDVADRRPGLAERLENLALPEVPPIPGPCFSGRLWLFPAE